MDAVASRGSEWKRKRRVCRLRDEGIESFNLRQIINYLDSAEHGSCWNWVGGTFGGYGVVGGKELRKLAHRRMYELVVGPISRRQHARCVREGKIGRKEWPSRDTENGNENTQRDRCRVRRINKHDRQDLFWLETYFFGAAEVRSFCGEARSASSVGMRFETRPDTLLFNAPGRH